MSKRTQLIQQLGEAARDIVKLYGDPETQDQAVEQFGVLRGAIGASQAASLVGSAQAYRSGSQDAVDEFLSTASTVADTLIRRSTRPTPSVPAESALEAFSEGGLESIRNLGRGAMLRGAQLMQMRNPSAQTERDIETMRNRQMIANEQYERRVADFPGAAFLGEITPGVTAGLLTGGALASPAAAGVAGAAAGAFDPNVDLMTGAALGFGMGAGGQALGRLISKAYLSRKRTQGRRRSPEDPELLAAREAAEDFGLETTSARMNLEPNVSRYNEIVSEELGLLDSSLKLPALAQHRTNVGQEIGKLYSGTAVSPSVEHIDRLTNIIEATEGSLGSRANTLRSFVDRFDNIVNEGTGDNGTDLFRLRSDIGRAIDAEDDFLVMSGYKDVQDYIDDVVLNNLSVDEASNLAVLRRQYGLTRDIMKSGVVDPASGAVDPMKVAGMLRRETARNTAYLPRYERLYNATNARLVSDLGEARTQDGMTSNVLQAGGRAFGGYSNWPIIRGLTESSRRVKSIPNSGPARFGGRVGTAAALGGMSQVNTTPQGVIDQMLYERMMQSFR